ncbi:MAG: BRO-N domain-containing protein [Pelagimonas sp.]|uniref:BRO-N domain-containing protein n=1 Tax=Pelagimonas sp. TaxID=2073170 RepID=UPI003D6BD6B3
MNTLPTNFEFNTNTIRVVEIDGDPWFVVTDVCKALGIGNPTMALSNISSTEVGNQRLSTRGGRPNKIITESGLYQMIFQSRKPEAKEFTHWVTGTVLPAIRKDGGYIMGEEKVATGEMDEDEFMARALVMATDKLERLKNEPAKANEDKAELTTDNVSMRNGVPEEPHRSTESGPL